ncbi:S4 domain-containing protein YaaA [Niallia sp. 01092]|uniref:S4 domain-containing protein YaaA n=1 Tax=unclassified Niallia TaxID=2837522 RepID=UPI003FD5531A
MTNQIKIDTEYITLGQFLKVAEIIQSGGMAKWFLSEYEVFVNGEQDQRRGRKLRSGDIIDIPSFGQFTVL